MRKAVSIRKRSWQVQHDAPHRDDDLSPLFEETFAQGRDLRSSPASDRQMKAHLLHQYVHLLLRLLRFLLTELRGTVSLALPGNLIPS